jgi:hypothetical protein
MRKGRQHAAYAENPASAWMIFREEVMENPVIISVLPDNLKEKKI